MIFVSFNRPNVQELVNVEDGDEKFTSVYNCCYADGQRPTWKSERLVYLVFPWFDHYDIRDKN